jgi:flavin-binding protein dodecin
MGIEKHLSITGSSTVSWKDAVIQAVNEASKTIDYLSSVRVIDQRAQIDGKKLTQYFVDLDIAFIIDRDRD